MRFVVERAKANVLPEEWERVGVSDQSGEGAPSRAVEAVADGVVAKYRVWPEDAPDSTYQLYALRADGRAHPIDA